MKQVLPIAFAILIIGCSTTSLPPPDLTFDTFESVLTGTEATYPSELPEIVPLGCYPSEEDCRVAGYTREEDVTQLDVYKTRAEGNTTIATENAAAVNALIAENGELVDAGRLQEKITVILQDDLAWEKQERKKEKWYYRILIVLVGGAGVYAAGN